MVNLKILTQGDVKIVGDKGYMKIGCDRAVCFFIDVYDRAYVNASSVSENGCPVIYVGGDDCAVDTEIEFVDYPGWRFHAGGGGKTIAIALAKYD